MDIGVLQPQAVRALDHDVRDLLRRVRQRHAQAGHRGLEARDMIHQPEEPPLPDMGDVVGRVGADEAAVEDGHACLGEGHPSAVHEGNALDVGGFTVGAHGKGSCFSTWV